MQIHDLSRASSSILSLYDDKAIKSNTTNGSGISETKYYINDEREFHSGGLLLEGEFNEKESHEAFKQAVLEWRKVGNQVVQQENKIQQSNSAKKLKKEVRIVDVIKSGIDVGTENGIDFTRTKNDILQDIEDKLTLNSNMSYAERLLLKKYRRSDIEDFFDINTKISSTANNLNSQKIANLANSKKISSNQAPETYGNFKIE
jgi:hypothetical protein